MLTYNDEVSSERSRYFLDFIGHYLEWIQAGFKEQDEEVFIRFMMNPAEGLKDSSKSFLLKGELLSRTSEGIYLLTQQDGFAVENQCPTFIPLQSIDFVRVKVSQIDRFGHPLLDTALLTALSISNGFFLLLTQPTALISRYVEHRAQHNLIEREFRGGSRMLLLYTRFSSNYTYEGYIGCTSLEERLVLTLSPSRR